MRYKIGNVWCIVMHLVCIKWDRRVAWSILWALGAWDSGSNPGGPISCPALAQFGRALDCRSKCCWFKSGRRDLITLLNWLYLWLWKINFSETFIYDTKYSNWWCMVNTVWLAILYFKYFLPWWCRGYHVGLSSPRLGFKSRPRRLIFKCCMWGPVAQSGRALGF